MNSRAETDVDFARGFSAEAEGDARVLVLGSLPGQQSIAAGEYYAHPRNTFWRITGELFGFSATLPYTKRVAALNQAGVALWDVLHASRRPGSLDSAINVSSARCNDFEVFFTKHRRIEVLAFNGQKAADLFRRLVMPDLTVPIPQRIILPSTSPAHAAMSYDDKLLSWRQICANCD